MNKTGRFLVMCGLVGRLVFNILKVVNFNAVMTFLSIASMLVAAAGFVMIFLSDRKIIDLVLAVGFSIESLSVFFTYLLNAGLTDSQSVPDFVAYLPNIFLFTLSVWTYKLMRSSKVIPMLAVFGAIVFFVSKTMLPTLFAAHTLVTVLPLVSIACIGLAAFAAFWEYKF